MKHSDIKDSDKIFESMSTKRRCRTPIPEHYPAPPRPKKMEEFATITMKLKDADKPKL